jgi:uncharacterized integral membrane protein
VNSESPSLGERRIRAGQTFRVIVGLVVLAAVVVFAALNTDKVNVDWAFDTADVALWVVIAVSVVAGVIIGYLARPRHR